MDQHVGDGQIVVEDGLAVRIQLRSAGGLVQFRWNQSLAARVEDLCLACTGVHGYGRGWQTDRDHTR
jgi:hypothetical protein